MKKNPILNGMEENSCGNLVNEINENSNILDAVNGAGWQWTVCTVLQGTIGCAVSWALGNGGYACSYSVECMRNCGR